MTDTSRATATTTPLMGAIKTVVIAMMDDVETVHDALGLRLV